MTFHGGSKKLFAKVTLAVIVLCLILLPATGETLEKINCRAFMFKNQDGRQPAEVFSPQDEIIVHVKFVQLPKGDYTFQAEWYNSFGEMQDSSTYHFSLQTPSNYAVESWLEINRAGFLKRLFSASETTGYSVKFYGKWQVKLYLNGEEVASKMFEVR